METAYLIVQVSDRLCALLLERGMEVVRLPALRSEQTGVQGLLGFAEIRGRLLPVLDLAELLELPASDDRLRKVVVVTLASGPAALAVQHVRGVRMLGAGAIETIALPHGKTQQLGRFDADRAKDGGFDLAFAQLIERGGLLRPDVSAAIAQAAERAGAAAPC